MVVCFCYLPSIVVSPANSIYCANPNHYCFVSHTCITRIICRFARTPAALKNMILIILHQFINDMKALLQISLQTVFFGFGFGFSWVFLAGLWRRHAQEIQKWLSHSFTYLHITTEILNFESRTLKLET